ncbi:hypothetical protein BASA81_008534 [Batrachochytrium salamandrivorans]|nr:hypothetical protein BASA81_008534 [Batrachochytrium salamandrivorans]
MGLVRQLSWLDGVSLVVGSIVGSGVFASSGVVARHTGSTGASLGIWAVAGGLALMGAMCYVELGTRFPSAGGEIAYLAEGFESSIWSYAFMWTNVIMTRPLSMAIVCRIVGEYLVEFVAKSSGGGDGNHTEWAVQLAALLAALSATLLLAVSTNAATMVLKGTTALKLAALGMIIGLAFWHTVAGRETGNAGHEISFAGSSTNWLVYPQALLSCLWAFDGWNSLNYASEELVGGSMVQIISLSLPGITLLYLLTNLAYFAVIPLPVVKSSETIGIDFIRLTAPSMEPLLLLCICLSTFGAAIGSMFTGSRIVYSAAVAGQLPMALGKLTSKGAPMVALGFQFALVVGFLLLGDFEFLVELFGCVAWLFYFITVMGLGRIRWRERGLEVEPHGYYRVHWLAIVLFLVVSLGMVCFSVAAKPGNGLIALLFVSSSLPIWMVWRRYTPPKAATTTEEEDGMELIPEQ